VPLFQQGNAFIKLLVTEEPEKESGIQTSTIKTEKEQCGRQRMSLSCSKM